jgi:sec-independent protein translocase protein TatA
MYQGTVLEFLNMGGGEIALIMVVVLLLFGGKKLPELARGLGKGIREFKDASEGVKREIHRNINSVDIDEENKKEELNHSEYHHPTEEQTMPLVENIEEHKHEIVADPIPEKGKESHIE